MKNSRFEYSGLRPDEKFYEECQMDLKDAVYEETGNMREMVKDIVPTYKMPKVDKKEV